MPTSSQWSACDSPDAEEKLGAQRAEVQARYPGDPLGGIVSDSREKSSRFRRLTEHIPRKQLLRYLLVGAWNTLFSYLTYAGLTAAFTRLTTFYPYVFAALLSNIFSITVSFLGYKWFVFKTKGNYLKEWSRALAVYTTSIAITTVSLPLLVGLLRHTTPFPRAAPYIAGGIICTVSVTMSFFGHKHFSFRSSKPSA